MIVWFVNYATDKRRERLINAKCKRETTAHRVASYSCDLRILETRGLAVRNMYSLHIISTDFWGFIKLLEEV